MIWEDYKRYIYIPADRKLIRTSEILAFHLGSNSDQRRHCQIHKYLSYYKRSAVGRKYVKNAFVFSSFILIRDWIKCYFLVYLFSLKIAGDFCTYLIIPLFLFKSKKIYVLFEIISPPRASSILHTVQLDLAVNVLSVSFSRGKTCYKYFIYIHFRIFLPKF